MRGFNKTIIYSLAVALFISVGFINLDANAGIGSGSLTIVNVTVPPGVSNIEYSGFGASPYPKGCDFEGGAIVPLDDGEEIQCNVSPGIYAVTELNGPFTGEVECNVPFTPHVPGVVSFTVEVQNEQSVVCTVTNTAIPLFLNSFFPGFSNFPNTSNFENGPVNDTVSIYFGFQTAPPGTQFYPAPCNSTPAFFQNPNLLMTVPSNMFGEGFIELFVPLLPQGFGVLFQAVNNQHCLPSNAFFQQFFLPL